ncbi:sulfotransferase [uncultured Nocardioides sp.]|uniref:sulfotransferase family protein n=1 Tax=uncultured Nocardioides sp. TaxID=198441 RepID=UPI00260712C7|nr:sulfotransferase [uncultured Nocardioides sp.]
MVAGVQKAGTSTLYRVLVSHQSIARAPQKEWHFFDDESRDWADPDFTGYEVARRGPRARATMSVDASPSYLFWPGALERIRAWNPDVPLVLCFRDPVDRAFSHWVMNYTRRLAPEERISFAETVRIGYDPSWIGSRPEGWSDKDLRTRSVVGRGLYGAQLAHAQSLFPAEQLHLLDFHEFVRDQHGTAERLVEALGLAPYQKVVEPQARSASRTDLEGEAPTAEDVEVLLAAYAEDLPLFERLSGIDTSGWTTSKLIRGELSPAEVAEKLGRKAGLIS